MKRIIGIVSGKGGVGKTVTAINLGLALHRFSQDVTVVDADTTASNLGLQLGLYSFQTTLQDVLIGKSKVDESVYVSSFGLKIVPASICLDSIDANISRLKTVIKKLDGIILVDSPPGLSNDALSVLDACDEVIVVATPELQTMTNAIKVIHIAKQKKKNVLGIILNRYNKDGYELLPEEIETMAEVPILSKIPEESNVRKSLFEKIPLLDYCPYSSAAIEYHNLAANLINEEYMPPKFLFLKNFLDKFRLLNAKGVKE